MVGCKRAYQQRPRDQGKEVKEVVEREMIGREESEEGGVYSNTAEK